jgi:hypothetical protein
MSPSRDATRGVATDASRDSFDLATSTRGVSVSTFRKTVLTTAIIGAGLASTAGSAFATDCSHDDGGHKAKHESSSGCSNSFVGKTGNSKALVGVLDSSQGAIGANVCDVLSHNNVANGNQVNLLTGLL